MRLVREKKSPVPIAMSGTDCCPLLFCNDETPLEPTCEYASPNQMLVGGPNPKTYIPPIVAAPSHALDEWKATRLVTHSALNASTNFDVYSSGYEGRCYQSGPIGYSGDDYERFRMAPDPPERCTGPIDRMDRVLTQTIQPNVYQRTRIDEPINSLIGISLQKQFDPMIIDERNGCVDSFVNYVTTAGDEKLRLPPIHDPTGRGPHQPAPPSPDQNGDGGGGGGGLLGGITSGGGLLGGSIFNGAPFGLARQPDVSWHPLREDFNDDFDSNLNATLTSINRNSKDFINADETTDRVDYVPRKELCSRAVGGCGRNTENKFYTLNQIVADEKKYKNTDYIFRQNESNVYDPRFFGYGPSDRGYVEKTTGQPRWFYDDIDAVKMPNFIARSNVDVFPWAQQYGTDVGEYAGDGYKQLANDAFLNDTLKFRTELQERLMRKRNAEMWQQRVAPITTMRR